MMKKNYLSYGLLFTFVLSTNASFAQAVSIPNNLSPGALNNTNMNSFNRPDYQQKQIKQKPAVKNRSKVLKSNVQTSERLVYDPEFTVNEIIFDGNTVIKDKKIEEFIAELKGRKVKVAELLDACQKITEYYHSKGYITSRARLMPQKVEGGIVELTIDEGKFGDIEINGNKWTKTRHIKAILKANGVKQDKVLNINDMKHAINEINNKSYIQGKIDVQDGASYDLKDITLNVEDRFPLDLNIGWNNDGQELVGRQRGVISMTHNNLTGYGDSLTAGAILGNGTTGAIGGYSVPIGEKGTRLNFNYGYSNMEYGGAYERLGLNGYTHEYSVGLTRPIHRGEKWMIDSGVSLNLKNVTSKMNYIGTLTDNRITSLKTGVSARRDDFKGITTGGLEVSTGLPFFNATEASEDLGYADSKFVKFSATLQRLHILPKGCLGLAKLNGQYTPNKLLSAEKMLLGGSSSMRGYDPAMMVGDMGFNGTFEVRTPVPFLKNILPEKVKPFADKVKMGAFYDYGLIRDMHGYSNYLSGKSTNFLQSAGVGIHFPLSQFLTANIDCGVPLGRGTFKDQDVRLSFSLSSAIHNLWNQKVKKPNL